MFNKTDDKSSRFVCQDMRHINLLLQYHDKFIYEYENSVIFLKINTFFSKIEGVE